MMKRLSVLSSCLLLLIAFLLAGCGELEFGIETRLTSGRPSPVTVVVTATQQLADNVVLVTITPTPGAETETPTMTPPATETATITPTPSPTDTATPTPTVRAGATSRPPAPTATPVPPQILSFTAVPAAATLGSTIAVNWSAEGASAILCVRVGSGYPNNCFETAVSGSYTLPVESDFRENIVFNLYVYNTAGQEAHASVYVPLDCPDDLWFFDNPPDGCPREDAVETFAAAQYFEGGWMLWLEETDTIYAFYEPQRTYGVFYPGFGDPDDPAADNSDYDPPDGLYVPVRGFGLAWRNYSYTRELLGWALAPEFGFDTVYQSDTDPYNNHLYILDPDGRLVVLDTYYLTWTYR
jgi:hypothetical protein